MTAEELAIIDATMLGYMAGLAEREHANPYAYIQAEAWSWQHGCEQGRLHRARSEVQALADARTSTNPLIKDGGNVVITAAPRTYP